MPALFYAQIIQVNRLSFKNSQRCLSASSVLYANMVKAKKFVLVKHFEDLPKESDLKIEEEELPELKNGEFLVEAVYLSVDPYMRAYCHRLKLGTVMIGGQVSKIVESKNAKFPVGKFIANYFGWRTHTIATPEKIEDPESGIYLLPDFGQLPLSLGLGMLGMPGNTAYFGFLEICRPKAGETVLVTGAAGAVGSHVGQIAKIKGCKVIGIAGSDEKGQWLKSLGFDHVINYKTENVHKELSKVATKGIDCYFDNVGGEISSIILQHMNKNGRIAVCGSISSYNNDARSLPKATIIQPAMVFQELCMEGFIVHRWRGRWIEGIVQNLEWLKEGKLQYKETVTQGFENMLKALNGVLLGENTGKAIVKV